MPIDIYTPRTMLGAIEQMTPPKTFLLSTFFGLTRTFPTETVDVDIVKGKRRMAPFVSPVVQGKAVTKRGYKTNTYKPPYIKPKFVTTAGQYLARQPGELLYMGKSPLERAAMQLGKELAELDEMITRREEWMASQALFTGKIIVSGDGIEDEIDFGMASGHLPTISVAANKWTADTSDPIADLTAYAQLIAKDSGIVPSTVVLGADVCAAFLRHALVQKFLDMKDANLMRINPRELPNGVSYVGTITAPGLNVDLFTYAEWYVDDNETEQPMVPVDRLLMGSTHTANARLYGAIQDVEAIEAGLVEAARYPKSWVEKDPSLRMLMLQSASLVALLQPDAFVSAKVI